MTAHKSRKEWGQSMTVDIYMFLFAILMSFIAAICIRMEGETDWDFLVLGVNRWTFLSGSTFRFRKLHLVT